MPFSWDTNLGQWVVAKLPEEYGGNDYLKQPRGIDLPPEIWQGQAGVVEKKPEPTYPPGKRPALARFQVVMSDGFDGSLGIIDFSRSEARSQDDDAVMVELSKSGFSIDRDPFAEAVARTGNHHRHSYHDIHHFLAGKKGLWHRWNRDSGEYSVVLYTEAALAYFHHRVRPFLLDDGCMIVSARMKEWDAPWAGEYPEYEGDNCTPGRESSRELIEEWEQTLTPEQLSLWESVK